MQYTYERAHKLASEYGSPLYVVDADRFRATFRHLEQAMLAEYPKYRVAYSVKTNYIPYLCSLVRECGGFAEVVSEMEYELARRMGFLPKDIIFNGPHKEGALERALVEGALVIADNAHEASEILDIASVHPDLQFEIGIRFNFDIDNGRVSRFGFDIESSDTAETLNSLRRAPNIELVAAHCHFTHARDLKRWKMRAEGMVDVAQRFFGKSLKCIDLGSGMYGEMDSGFAKLFGDNIPVFEDYARVIGPIMSAAFADMPEEERPILVTEPGTTLVANALDCICCVTGVKKVRGREFISLDAGIHVLGELSAAKNLPLQVLHGASYEATDCASADMAGYTCLEYDVVYRGYKGPISKGDIVVFGNVGSYSVDMKPPFIKPGCAAVAVEESSDRTFLVKRRETIDDVFATYGFDF